MCIEKVGSSLHRLIKSLMYGCSSHGNEISDRVFPTTSGGGRISVISPEVFLPGVSIIGSATQLQR